MAVNAAYWLVANRSLISSRLLLYTLRLPDKSLDGSPSISILDTLDFLGVAEGAKEGDRKLELDSSMTTVDANRPSPVVLAEVETRLRDVDRDPESAARVSSPEEPDELLTVEDKENQFSGLA